MKTKISYIVLTIVGIATIMVIIGSATYQAGEGNGYQKAKVELEEEYKNRIKVQNLKEIELTPVNELLNDEEAFFVLSKTEIALAVTLAQNDLLVSALNFCQEKKVYKYLEEVKEVITSKETQSEVELMLQQHKELLAKSKEEVKEKKEILEQMEKTLSALDSIE